MPDIFVAPRALAASVGSDAPLAFLACALGIGAVGICCAEGGSRVPTSGGMFGYTEAALEYCSLSLAMACFHGHSAAFIRRPARRP